MGLEKSSITTGQIATCWNEFEKILRESLGKDSKTFFSIPVSVIVKRRSNNQPVDQLRIENIAMEQKGRDIWLECFVDDDQMIEKEPKVKKHLDDSQEKFTELSVQLKNKIKK